MYRKIAASFICLVSLVSVSLANSLYILDSPTTGILNYGSYDVSFRFFGRGSVQTRLDFGVFKFMYVGIAWELDDFIGNENAKIAVPALSVKIRLYEGNMAWPSFAIGYDGQGYFYDQDYDDDYRQRGKGLYLVAGREVFFEGLNVNLGMNMNNFKEPGVHGFVNAIIPAPFAKDTFFFMAEYDNIGYFPDARLNFGLRLTLTEAVDIDFMMRDCWGKEADDKFPNERVFKVSYSGKF
ncbi:MAG: hypothetical protein LBL00_03770 [Endomicrobium sp.]|jgi:hypothetical protein|nr:hypothetical protein [Endomicrobium sp.]